MVLTARPSVLHISYTEKARGPSLHFKPDTLNYG